MIQTYFNCGKSKITVQLIQGLTQQEYRPWPACSKKPADELKTVFSQLCDQMILKRNYAKTFMGLRTRIISKVAAVTLFQYINWINDRPMNRLKHVLTA